MQALCSFGEESALVRPNRCACELSSGRRLRSGFITQSVTPVGSARHAEVGDSPAVLDSHEEAARERSTSFVARP